MATVADERKMPKRLKYKLIGNGRLKFYFDEDVGGSYLTYANVVEDVLRAGKADGYADFVEDSPEWKKRKPV